MSFTSELDALKAAVEAKFHPIVNAVHAAAEAEYAAIRGEFETGLAEAKAEWATVEQQLKQRIADLEAKVEQLLGQQPAPAPAEPAAPQP